MRDRGHVASSPEVPRPHALALLPGHRPRGHRRAHALAALLVAAATVVAAPPAFADPTLSGTAAPTAAQVREQQREAARLQALADAQAGRADEARAALAGLADQAAAALEALDVALAEARTARAAAEEAEEQEQAARKRQRAAEDELARIAGQVDDNRAQLGRYAAAAYRSGGNSELQAAARLLEDGDVSDLGRQLSYTRMVGGAQGKLVDRLETARARQARLTAEAADAAADAEAAAAVAEDEAGKAEAAAQRADEARATADALVADQRAVVAALEEATAQGQQAAAAAAEKAANMAQARQIAEQRLREAEAQRLADEAAGLVQNPRPGARLSAAGDCVGGDVGSYPNGLIPPSLLCPLWGAGGHILRADAAAAYSAMSKAFAAETGSPLCITDSYRSLELQIDLKLRKPVLAARPGTSEHGWGKAVDFCDWRGGARASLDFSSATYAWLSANGPRFGWYNPSWARQGGSKPEPWHWEYGG